MSTSNPNRNKFLLGFSAVVAVLIVAFFMWPANVQKEDASGSIGAVQKHHAPQITQQDVILGGEPMKEQQRLLYKDFQADAGKLRAIGSSHDVAAARTFENELKMRFMRAAQEAVDVANRVADARMKADIEELKMMAAKGTLSNDEMLAFDRKIADVVQMSNAAASISRFDKGGEELASVKLADEQLAAKVADIDQAFSHIQANFALADLEQYLDVVQTESKLAADEELLQHATASEYNLEAEQVEARAKQNMTNAVLREEAMAARCQRVANDIQIAESRAGTTQAKILGSGQLGVKLGALAGRLRSEETASRQFADNLRQVNGRISQ